MHFLSLSIQHMDQDVQSRVEELDKDGESQWEQVLKHCYYNLSCQAYFCLLEQLQSSERAQQQLREKVNSVNCSVCCD